MRPEQEDSPEEPNDVAEEGALPPLVRGRPLSLEESVERMYERFDKTFEELAK